MLLAAMAGAFAGAVTITSVGDFFALDWPPRNVLIAIAAVVAAAGAVLELGRRVSRSS